MKDLLADLLVFVALALVTTGVALLSLPVGFIVAGLGLAAIAIRMGTTK
jgi:hypothetical protein